MHMNYRQGESSNGVGWTTDRRSPLLKMARTRRPRRSLRILVSPTGSGCLVLGLPRVAGCRYRHRLPSCVRYPHRYHTCLEPVTCSLNHNKAMADQVKDKLALLRTKLDQIPALQKAEVRVSRLLGTVTVLFLPVILNAFVSFRCLMS